MKQLSQLLGKIFKGDAGIWTIMVLLTFVSIAAIYSATGLLAFRYQQGHTGHYVMRHTVFLLIGWAAMLLFHRVKYTHFARGTIVFVVLAIVLLLYTLTMAKVNGASRWFRVFGKSFQPSELAKVVLIVYMARQLTKYRNVIKEKSTFWRLAWAPAVIILLIFPENLSTAVLLALTCFVMMIVGGVRARYLWATAGVGAGVAALMLALFLWTPQGSLPGRMETWRNRLIHHDTDDAEGATYQVTQAEIAVATGGLFGKGPGQSTQRNFLPHPYSDYVYALIIEEYGIFIGWIILILYLWLFSRGMKVVRQSQGSFGSYLALGIIFIMTAQAMVNMGVAVHLLPVTGQPLPFVSMGGTSLVFTGIAVGMLQSVAAANKVERTSVRSNGERSEPKN